MARKRKKKRPPKRKKVESPPGRALPPPPTGQEKEQPAAPEDTDRAGAPQLAVEPEAVIALDEPVVEPGEGDAGALDEGEEYEGRLSTGMFRSRKLLRRPFSRMATRRAIDPEFWSDAEEALIAADTGVECASEIVERARGKILREGIRDIEGLKGAFRAEVVEMLRSFGDPPVPNGTHPRVLFIVGVNGVGKTTTTAKIGHLMRERGEKVLFAAADTFRAAGIEQMEMWANRLGAPVVRHKTGGDPAAVVFDAVESAGARGIDVVLVDTAGRLHTKKNLMEELGKMWRVADRNAPGTPEAILVIDATTGQNGIIQARVFGEALDVRSIALTKMDGSARGGVVMAIGRETGIPVAFIGVGEGLSDLRPFDPEEYARALF